MKHRLVAGTINKYIPEEGWHNTHIDISRRSIYDQETREMVRPDFIGDIRDMRDVFPAETFDEVRCHHVLEHLPPSDVSRALREFRRVLKPGGVLDIEVPDLDRVAQAYVIGEIDFVTASQWFLGQQLTYHEPTDSHRSRWTESELRRVLGEVGLTADKRIDSPGPGTCLALRLRATV